MKIYPDFDSNSGFFSAYQNYIQNEYQLQAEMEEARGKEILELQNSLQAVQAKVNVTNALLTIDRESVQKKIDKLSASMEELKSLLESERKCKQGESSEIKQQILEETANKQNQLQESINRLEEKLANIEKENEASRLKITLDHHSPSTKLKVFNMEKKPQKPQQQLNEKQRDLLIRCITQHLGFSKGRPIAACIIYKCLRQWGSCQVEKTNIFESTIQTIDKAIKTQENNNEVLAYWLSNVSTLLLLLQHTLGQVEALYYAWIFKHEYLPSYIEKIYRMIRDNLKKEISPFLNLCIQAPRAFESEFLHKTNDSQDILIAYWQGIVNKMDSFLNTLKSNHVSPFLVRKIFVQTFSFINVQLFNSVMIRKESCTFGNGEYLKAGLSELEHWCYKASEEYAGSTSNELKHIREAVEFLLYGNGTNAWYSNNKYTRTHSCLSPNVISHMRMLMDSENAKSTHSLLLNFDLSIPFSVDDLYKSTDEIDVEDVELPPLMCDNPSFNFLMPQDESKSFGSWTSALYGSLILKFTLAVVALGSMIRS